MDKKLKVGVFGVGSLGQHHARVYSELDTTELVGLCDVDATRAQELAAKHGVQAFADPVALAERIDAASVAVPTDHHFAVASLLMERGLHLLIEKPIASSTQEAEALVALAQEKGIVLQVGHIERFNPVMQFLEDNLATPRFIEATRLGTYPPPREVGVPRGTEVSVVLDLMIHDIEIILHLVRSEIKQIHAVGVPVLSPSEDIANVRLLFENGCVANITASRISQERMRKIRVFQEDTYLSLDYMNQAGQLGRKTDRGIETVEVPIEKDEPLKAELASFAQSVLTRSDPVVTGENASRALRIAAEICRQIRETPS